MKRALALSSAATILVCLLPARTAAALEPLAPGAEAPKPPERPKYQDVRYEENWAVTPKLADHDFFDPIKFIPFNTKGDMWAGFGGQLRLRGELMDDFAFGAPPNNDDTYGLARLRLYGDVHLTQYFRFYVEGISALINDRDLPGGKRPIDRDRADILNGFVDLVLPMSDGDAKLTARVGRQELKFGKDRLVSPLDWANTRRTFDAARLILNAGPVRIDAFHGQLVVVENTELNDSSSASTLSGVYANGKVSDAVNVDGYWLYNHQDMSTWGKVAGFEERYTLGMRVGGKLPKGFDYDAEYAYQFGDHARRTIAAWFLSASAGVSPDVVTKPRFEVGFDYASGDSDPTDREVNTASQLFPLGHAYFGFIDLIGRQNIVAANAGIGDSPLKGLNIKVDGHLFYRAEGTDPVYNAGGAPLPRPKPSTETAIGKEVDVTVKYAIDPHATVVAGYSRLVAGDYIKATGPASGVDFAYLMGIYNF